MSKSRYTQKKKVLDWLQTYGDLSFRDAVKFLDILDVRKRIEELRNEGYNILTIKVPNKNYSVYRLIEEAEA
jgi:hypothetical protein